ncbi:hypothetical protein ALC62_04077 [Cyphomyrmex costatus]|uniref:Uncharacterized protein n=2 Tax=Cyphomyrmex costatus TaxID=456900 RepID=A0A151IKM7_9HYME|nr:hypothetical protein ALC62_04077 [Cyphomyrmex costatus]
MRLSRALKDKRPQYNERHDKVASPTCKIGSWIASKDDQFFRRGIRTLPERWEKV